MTRPSLVLLALLVTSGTLALACARGDEAALEPDVSAASPPPAPAADATTCTSRPETCNGADDDCNGIADDVPAFLDGSLTAPVDAHWSFAGRASQANTFARLTPDIGGVSGALWWNAPFTFDAFEVSATFWTKADAAAGADGYGFAWVPGTDVRAVGAPGEGFGIFGLGGYGVVVDTFRNTGEPPAPFLVVYDGASGAHLARAALPEVRDGKEHRLRVKLEDGRVSAWLDGVSYLNDFTIPGYEPFAGHWGFTAGTGGSAAAYWIKDATMSFPRGQGCVR